MLKKNIVNKSAIGLTKTLDWIEQTNEKNRFDFKNKYFEKSVSFTFNCVNVAQSFSYAYII